MLLRLKDKRTAQRPLDVESAACEQLIMAPERCSSVSEAAQITSHRTAIAIAGLLDALHRRKRITDDDVLELLHEFEKVE